MAKPSIFSRNYEQRMKRRKINIILFIILLVCMAFFGGIYYLKKNNINLLPDFSSKKQDVVKPVKNKPVQTKPNKTEPEVSTPIILDYKYTLKDGKIINIEYTGKDENRMFKGPKDGALTLDEYSISPDKKSLVFIDKLDQSLIMANIDGTFKDITKENVIYKNGNKLTRKVIERQNDYIWNAKPQFTSDGNIVYLSNMPSPGSDSELTLWAIKFKEENKHIKVTKVSRDISLHKFEGFDAQGILKLNTPNGYINISKDGYTVTK